MRIKIIFLIFLTVVMNYACSSVERGNEKSIQLKERLIVETIKSKAIKNNLIGEDEERKVLVYLPPSYYESEKKYPVLYYLAAFNNSYDVYTNGTFQGFHLKDSLDDIIKKGMSKEMIVVLINGKNRVGGSFYVNSSVTGNWEDFVRKEVMCRVESTYRVIREKESRAIAGHAMGGTAALNIASKYPELYSVIYMLSPVFMVDEDLKNEFFSSKNLNRIYRKLEQFENKGQADKKKIFEDVIINYEYWDFAYGMAFAPNTEPPYLKLPYNQQGKKLIEDKEILKLWIDGFANLDQKITKNKENLKLMRGIAIDIGRREENKSIFKGSRYLNELFYRNGISISDYIHEGDHSSDLRNSIEKRMMPFLSQRLKFENK